MTLLNRVLGWVIGLVAIVFIAPMMVLANMGFEPYASLVRNTVTNMVQKRKGVARRRTWHSGPARSSQWGELLLPAIYNFFEVGRSLRPSLIPRLYNVQTSERAYEEYVGVGGIAPDSWGNYKNSGVPSMVDFNKGYKTTFTHDEFIVRWGVERKLMDDDQYGVIRGYAEKLGISAMQKRETDAASLFNNAFTSATGGDGKALCATDHPASPSNISSGGQQSNSATLALTKANVGTARTAMMNFTDDVGNKLAITPNLLLVPPALEDTALEIVNSLLDPSSANNASNPQAGRFQVASWHFLSDTNAWFMIDTVWANQSLMWFDRKPLEITLYEQAAAQSTYEAYMRYTYGWNDWRWVYGSNPS